MVTRSRNQNDVKLSQAVKNANICMDKLISDFTKPTRIVLKRDIFFSKPSEKVSSMNKNFYVQTDVQILINYRKYPFEAN